MNPTQVLQEIRKMRFEEAYEGWSEGRLTQACAARILGVCERGLFDSNQALLLWVLIDPAR